MTRLPPEERPAPRRVVADTDVASFVFKRGTRRSLYAPHLKGRILVISFQTVAEVERWALGRGCPRRGWGVPGGGRIWKNTSPGSPSCPTVAIWRGGGRSPASARRRLDVQS